MGKLLIIAILVLLFPATLGAVLPELSSADIRRALEMVRAREEDSLLEKYGRPYPFRTPREIRQRTKNALAATTPDHPSTQSFR